MSKAGVSLRNEIRRKRKTWDLDSARKAFEDAGLILLATEYKNVEEPMPYRCPKHPDVIQYKRIHDMKKAPGCPMCSNVARLRFDEVKAEFSRRGYDLLETEYKNSSTPMKYVCRKHPSVVRETTFSNLRHSGGGCLDCKGIVKHTLELVREAYEEKGLVLTEDRYVNNKYKMKCYCVKHPDKIIRVSYFQVQSAKGTPGCEECVSTIKKSSAASRKVDLSKVKKVFEEKGYTLLSDAYINCSTPMPYKCSRHPERIQYGTYTQMRVGSGCYYCGRESAAEKMRGERNPSYNTEKTDEERVQERSYKAIQLWRDSVYDRDEHTCQGCAKRGGRLNAHHLDGYHWCKEKRLDVSNGVTLCVECHRSFHKMYGNRNNTREQFEEWIEAKRAQGYNVLYRTNSTDVKESNVIGERSTEISRQDCGNSPEGVAS
ncbi:hypothetical protein ACQKK5_08170 [Brevibacillus panacihumi]|uniref:hypothetical protein n=1 Tax=Brevibacillus panacihumi TaxID=497735 RepID=UPI003D017D89